MPIRINLLAEAQAAEEMRRKDPVKRAAWLGGFVVFVVLLYAATLQFKIIVAKSENSTLQGSWRAIEKEVGEVNQQRGKTRELESKLAALDQFTTNRMLWAVALNALQHSTVDGVQVVRVQTEQSFVQNEPPRSSDPNAKPTKPATTTEKIAVTIEARDYSPRPGDQVSKYKQALSGNAFFEGVLQKTNTIQLTSQTAPQSELGRSFVGFGYKMYFEEKERRLYE